MAQEKVVVTVKVLPHPDLCPDGVIFEAKQGSTLLNGMLKHGIEVEHACEKVCACATCHVYIREGGQSLAIANEAEEDELDHAWGLEAESRLSCQVKIATSNIVVELPRHTRNLAKEH